MANTKMTCPKCGGPMNHHADKLSYSTGRNEHVRVDPSLGGVIEETHSCPGCGMIATRSAE